MNSTSTIERSLRDLHRLSSVLTMRCSERVGRASLRDTAMAGRELTP
jgi:hypothetical protein